VHTTSQGGVVVNQNFNKNLAEMLKKDSPATDFDPTGLYLDHIDGSRLLIGYRSDSGKGSFKFKVELMPNGNFQMVSNSIVFND
jgi:hypothetical protein